MARETGQDRVMFRSRAARRGYTAFPNAVLFSGEITPTARVLYGLLCEYARSRDYAWPGQKRLGRELGSRKHGPLKERQVRTYLYELAGLGLITIEQQGDKRTNHYIIEEIPAWLLEDPPPESDRQYIAGPARQSIADPDRQSIAAKEKGKVIRKTRIKNDSNGPAPQGERSAITQSAPATDPVYNPYIGLVITDFSREFGDMVHNLSNVAQACRLWQESGLSQDAFVGLLQQAKLALRHAQAHGVANKMAYFFTVLRDYITKESHPDGDPTEAGPRAPAQIPPTTHPAA